MAVSKRTRFEVLRRDEYTCRYCRSADGTLTVDHVVPVALGGSDAPDNLVAACRDCNAGKSSASPDAETVADVAADAVRWAAAMKTVARDRAKRRRAANSYERKFVESWPYVVEIAPDDWRRTVATFYSAGLPVDDLIDSLRIARDATYIRTKDVWRYMCGVAWKKLTEIQDEAARIVGAR